MSLFEVDLTGQRVLFVHIPKTGGTSIRAGRQIGQYSLYSPSHSLKGLPSLAFVRDPLARIISCWKDFRFIRGLVSMSFESFVGYITRLGADEFYDDVRTIEHHAAPMVHPVHGLRHAEFVGRWMYLQRDFDLFCARQGLARVDLPCLRDSSGFVDPRVSESVISKVRDFYSEDYRLCESIGEPCDVQV